MQNTQNMNIAEAINPRFKIKYNWSQNDIRPQIIYPLNYNFIDEKIPPKLLNLQMF